MENEKKNDFEKKPMNRWIIAISGTVLQVCLGTVYAWSYFQKPIMENYGWNNTQVVWIFSIAICSLGIAAAWGGMNLAKIGPHKLAISGAALYGLGYILSSIAMKYESLVGFYIAFGVIGGIGLGLGYVTPVATAAKWFPDKKGFVTGMVVMGFGLGALVMSKVIAPLLMKSFDGNLISVFLFIGVILMVIAVLSAAFMKNPPKGYIPAGWTPHPVMDSSEDDGKGITALKCILSRRFILPWLFFTSNIVAGIIFIGFQSPMLQDLLKNTEKYMSMSPEAKTMALASAGATLIAISSLFNGLGRFFWGSISDKIGRTNTFRILLGSQIIVFVAFLFVKSPIIFGILVCYVLLCYGGGFGTAPSMVLTIFGARLMPVIYGVMLTAWSAGGIIGPQIRAFIKDHFAGDKVTNYTFTTGIAILVFGLILTFLSNDKHFELKEEK